MKRIAWTAFFLILFLTYYLSSIPGLQVLPVFRQVNSTVRLFDNTISELAAKIVARLPEQMDPAKTFFSRLVQFAVEHPDVTEFMLRKTAHVLLFFCITVVVFFLLRQYLQNPFGALITAAVLSGVIAFLDEFYQTFVSGRDGSIVDVIIDLFGVALACFFIAFALLITGRASSGSSSR
ncbi:MAG TPA: VanZ family protein [Bacillota bacterium]|nr:VanZ family protein [Bacillota bacterium]